MDDIGLENCGKFLEASLSKELSDVPHFGIIPTEKLPLWATQRFPKACLKEVSGERLQFWKSLLTEELMIEFHLLLPALIFLYNHTDSSWRKEDILEMMDFLKKEQNE